MRDLVSYNERHNEANGEGNNDGESHNRSWNCGVEGPTDDPAVVALRERQHRNFLVTLLLSQGVPMLAHGDEIARSQGGNNNGYAQDNEVTWMDWELDESQEMLLEWTRRLVAMRHGHPVFRRRRFFSGTGRPDATQGSEGRVTDDIAWLAMDGRRMGDGDWDNGYAQSVMVFLNGDAIHEPDARGERIVDDSFLMLFNASPHDLDSRCPARSTGQSWHVVVDTGDLDHLPPRTHPYTTGRSESSRLSTGRDAERLTHLEPGATRTVVDRSVVVLRSDKRARGVTGGRHRPVLSTYRLQVRPEFAFDDALAVVDHLDALGVSHAYLSPVLQATPAARTGTTSRTTPASTSSSAGASGCARWPTRCTSAASA